MEAVARAPVPPGKEAIDHAHQRRADPATAIAGDDAHDRTNEGRKQHREKADQQRNAAGLEQPGGNISTQGISAENVAAGKGRRKSRPQVDVKGVVWQQVGREDAGQDQANDQG